eukprot:GCRY01001344.1.p1 GENE.GCRY01001344.1~~GCRY01001344.1.p1  ORF type:complete len:368 (-),score=53.07 GCRY01001344.1:52-1155(-)
MLLDCLQFPSNFAQGYHKIASKLVRRRFGRKANQQVISDCFKDLLTICKKEGTHQHAAFCCLGLARCASLINSDDSELISLINHARYLFSAEDERSENWQFYADFHNSLEDGVHCFLFAASHHVTAGEFFQAGVVLMEAGHLLAHALFSHHGHRFFSQTLSHSSNTQYNVHFPFQRTRIPASHGQQLPHVSKPHSSSRGEGSGEEEWQGQARECPSIPVCSVFGLFQLAGEAYIRADSHCFASPAFELSLQYAVHEKNWAAAVNSAFRMLEVTQMMSGLCSRPKGEIVFSLFLCFLLQGEREKAHAFCPELLTAGQGAVRAWVSVLFEAVARGDAAVLHSATIALSGCITELQHILLLELQSQIQMI